MEVNHSTEETDDIELLEELSKCLERDDSSTFPTPIERRSCLGDLKNLPAQSPPTKSTNHHRTLGQSNILDFMNYENCNVPHNEKTVWRKKLEYFYQLLEELITIDQEVVYLKNLADRYCQKKKCQCVRINIERSKISPWQYLPKIEPLPTEASIRVCSTQLDSSFQKSQRIWNHLLNAFTSEEARMIFREMDFESKGQVDIYDIIGQLEYFTGRSFSMRDVINLYQRLTTGENLLQQQFVSLFAIHQ